MTSPAEKKLIAYAMLGAAWDEMHEQPKRICQDCRFRIEHNESDRCARSGKLVVLDGSCKSWEVRIDD